MSVLGRLRVESGRLKARLEQYTATQRDRDILASALAPGLWVVDDVMCDSATTVVTGWAASVDGREYAVTLDGQPAREMRPNLPRPDLALIFPFIPNSPNLGFHAHFRGAANGRELNWSDAQSLHPFRAWQSVFVPPAEERWPLPDAARMRRAHSTSHAMSYRILGYSTLQKLNRILQRSLNRGVETFHTILDWGCGCGRVLRYLTDASDGHVIGSDIDADNVNWLRQNIPAAQYCVFPLVPPTELRSNSVDLAIGISVLTHLNEEMQWAWLQELKRVLTIGGVAAVTVHGPTAAAQSGRASLLRRLTTDGIVAAKNRYDLHDVLSVSDYYGTTYHSHGYIREQWSRFFVVQDIIEACVGNVQDVVLLVKA